MWREYGGKKVVDHGGKRAYIIRCQEGKQKYPPQQGASPERGCLMATSKFTNLSALTAAIALAKGEPCDVDREVLIAKLEHMAEQTAKTRKGSAKSGPTKAQRELVALTDAVVAKMTAGQSYGTPEIRELIDRDVVRKFAVPFNSNGVVSPQKITAIMGNAVKRGLVTKGEPVKGAARYELA